MSLNNLHKLYFLKSISHLLSIKKNREYLSTRSFKVWTHFFINFVRNNFHGKILVQLGKIPFIWIFLSNSFFEKIVKKSQYVSHYTRKNTQISKKASSFGKTPSKLCLFFRNELKKTKKKSINKWKNSICFFLFLKKREKYSNCMCTYIHV